MWTQRAACLVPQANKHRSAYALHSMGLCGVCSVKHEGPQACIACSYDAPYDAQVQGEEGRGGRAPG